MEYVEASVKVASVDRVNSASVPVNWKQMEPSMEAG